MSATIDSAAAAAFPICENPVEQFLRTDRMPHIWCPGCGIGTTVNCFARALLRTKIDPKKVVIVSGIGCTGRVAGYVHLDSFHTTHGRAIPSPPALLANPELTVVVYSGDGDLASIGGNHLIHAARRNIDIKVICVNNLTYSMTGGQAAATTPRDAITATSPYGAYEPPLNLPHLVAAAGASFVSRWTTYHVAQTMKAMERMLTRRGFSFLEVISPCPTLFQRRNRLGDGLDTMKSYKELGVTRHNANLADLQITMAGEIVIGNFLETERPDYLEAMQAHLRAQLQEQYADPYEHPDAASSMEMGDLACG